MANLQDDAVRTSSGSIDFDRYREKALAARSAALREYAPPLSPATTRRLVQFELAFALATGAFWAVILTDPPRTEAGGPSGSFEMMRVAPLDLPALVSDPI